MRCELVFVSFICFVCSSFSVETEFDLLGDGTLKKVNTPFAYYTRQNEDKFTLIYESAYKVYTIEDSQNDVAVIGLLRPCIAIAATDGIKLVAFHKHCTNSLESMKEILKENLNLLDNDNVYARIYTTRDDVEWEQNKRSLMHKGKSHEDEVLSIKNYLYEEIGINESNIFYELKSLRDDNGELYYPNHSLGRYEYVELCVSVRLNDVFEEEYGDKRIKFTSIDPYAEDILMYKGSSVDFAMEDEDSGQMQVFRLPYDDMDYERQQAFYEAHIKRVEDELYFKYYGKTPDDLFTAENFDNIYNSFSFLTNPSNKSR